MGNNELPTYMRVWSEDFHFTHKSTISCYAQEKNFKLMSRWYRDPSSLRRIFPSTPANCWRCGLAEGTYEHIWWECSRIQPFWSQVFTVYNTIYNASLLPSPEVALLSVLPGSIASQKKSLLCFLLSAAKQLIPLFYKWDIPPSLALWVSTVNDMMWMEEMLAMDNDFFKLFKGMRYVWIDFSTSDAFKALL